MIDLYSGISIFSMILTVAGIIGGVLVFKSGISRTAYEVQERVINAMQSEIAVLRSRLEDLENENKRLDQVIYTLCEALKKRGLIVTIEGHIVTVSDGHETQSVRIREK
ncbi:MAG TPA: hypothetical protein VHZ51_27490 [Ktedonobacteraceae bacterium]|jgi:hypothetical protein|nr:hypothetical protein [Ktedonobacteraceae bacterium]